MNGNEQINRREMKENLSNVNSSETHFLHSKARVALTNLKKTFTEVLILYNLDRK